MFVLNYIEIRNISTLIAHCHCTCTTHAISYLLNDNLNDDLYSFCHPPHSSDKQKKIC